MTLLTDPAGRLLIARQSAMTVAAAAAPRIAVVETRILPFVVWRRLGVVVG